MGTIIYYVKNIYVRLMICSSNVCLLEELPRGEEIHIRVLFQHSLFSYFLSFRLWLLNIQDGVQLSTILQLCDFTVSYLPEGIFVSNLPTMLISYNKVQRVLL
jgi:hypothetical protein